MRGVLELDPDDRAWIRHRFLLSLMERERYDDALELVRPFQKDAKVAFAYALALLLYRREGDSPEARSAIRYAFDRNREVSELLLYPQQRASQLALTERVRSVPASRRRRCVPTRPWRPW